MTGGFIFEHLEQTNEKEECITRMHKYYPMANDTKHELWEASKGYVKVRPTVQ